jgi:GTPase
MDRIYNSIYYYDKKKFKSEIEEGNIEYKWRLDTKDVNGLKKIVSQMLWRLNEGYELINHYEAHYLLGVYDSGELGGLSMNELIDTKLIFDSALIKAKTEIIKEKIITIDSSTIAFITIRKIPENKKIEERNIIFIGSSGIGKTTTIGNLCFENNDFNPIYRNSILLHPHEKISGKTTTIKKDIVGVKNTNLITYNYSTNWGEIASISDLIINLYDTPGSNLKNMIYCLSSINHDKIILFDDNKPIVSFIKKYTMITSIPLYIVTRDNYQLNDLRQNLLDVTKHNNGHNEIINSMFRITTIYTIPDNGNIISGHQISDTIHRNTHYKLIGSYDNLSEFPVKILTIHKKNQNSTQIEAGESGALSLEIIDKIKINKNMIIVPESEHIEYYYNSIKVKILYEGKKPQSDNFLVYSGNFVFRGKLKVNDNTSEIIFDKKIYLQTSLLILIPINIPLNESCENYLIIAKFKTEQL